MGIVRSSKNVKSFESMWSTPGPLSVVVVYTVGYFV